MGEPCNLCVVGSSKLDEDSVFVDHVIHIHRWCVGEVQSFVWRWCMVQCLSIDCSVIQCLLKLLPYHIGTMGEPLQLIHFPCLSGCEQLSAIQTSHCQNSSILSSRS